MVKGERNDVSLELSLNGDDKRNILDVKRKMLENELEDFEPIKENDINIGTSYVFDNDDKIEVGVFFRNGFKNAINFDTVPLKLVDENGQLLCEKIFSLRDLGDIPSLSARPYKLYFDKVDKLANRNISQEWKVIFNSNIKAVNTVKVEYEDLDKNDIDAIRFFENYLDSLPLLKKGQVDIKIYEVRAKEDDKFKVTILIRNGANKSATLEQLPVTLNDNNGKVFYSALLSFKDVKVSSMKAKMINFIVKCDNLDRENLDLSRVTVDLKTI